MRFIFFTCFLIPFFCVAQSTSHLGRAQTHTFQLVVPTPKYIYMYSEVVTDSLLAVIETKRLPSKNAVLPLNLGMSILILSKEKVDKGIRIPKVEVKKP